ncbi:MULTISPECIES: DUF6482 family protein [unclassified Halomonas]|uniref:DUF6482 family protein n=1 Tax=unclassified Halomonas TaxID=2609666 RepID=UPI0007D8F8D6|nr:MULTISPECIES: DUF6482 family protein [unclassified Halomonas]MBT2786296.1 hypothetical protein [Halomonas sp. ISL-106]MBT2797318.1 hypothetical protein [Halomonas sp. ISL-104]OAL58691.1 hypothetical protein A6R74_07310 [Halomonas sp. ALS9]
MSSPLPAHLTLDELAQCSAPLPDVEVHGLDRGWYIVRLHQDNAVSLLTDQSGEAQRFTGTQWIGRALAPLGFTHGTLTWADAADEMIGSDVPSVSAQQRLAYGVRVAFNQTSL